MNHDPLETWFAEQAPQEGLTPEERMRMRMLLSEYVALQPIRETPSQATLAPLAWLSSLSRVPTFALIILILLGTSGGLAYAAEGSLPGDPLYGVKVDVIEPLHTALASTPEAQASWHMTLAARRVDEAATLAAENRLASSTEATLAMRFMASADAAREALAREGNEPDATTVASATFASRLHAYQAVFARLDGTRESTDQIQLALASETEALSPPSPHAEAALFTMMAPAAAPKATSAPEDATAPAPVRAVATVGVSLTLSHIAQNVDQTLSRTATLIGDSAHALTASSSAEARRELARAGTLADQGRRLLGTGDTDGALSAFKDSLAVASRLDVLTRAAANLHIDAFGSPDVPREPGIPVRAAKPAFHRSGVPETGSTVRTLMSAEPAEGTTTASTTETASSTASSTVSISASTTASQESQAPEAGPDTSSSAENSSNISVPSLPLPTIDGSVPNLPVGL